MKGCQARFVESSPYYQNRWSLPEIALTGRSNVGKSSLINALLGRKNLAKTSGTPGKTQLINRFCIDESWYIMDLPGYGWARVSQKKRRAWGGMVQRYLLESTRLVLVLLLLDSRRTPQPIDLEFACWLKQQKLPFAIVFTKADKVSMHLQNRHSQCFIDALQETSGCDRLEGYIATSSKTRLGLDALGNIIAANLSAYSDTVVDMHRSAATTP